MCTPTLLIAATAGQALFGAYTSMQQGKYQQAVANAQAKQAEYQAQDAISRGREAEQDHRMKVAQLKSKQIAEFAANGVSTSSGSPLNVIGDTAALGETDALRIRRNAYSEASGYYNQAGVYRAAGDNASTQGMYGAAGSLLGGAGKVASQYYQFKRDGALNGSLIK